MFLDHFRTCQWYILFLDPGQVPLRFVSLTHCGRDVMDIFKCIFLKEYVWISIKMSLKFVPRGPINNIPALFRIMAWCRPAIGNPIINMRRSSDRLRFIMGIPISITWRLLLNGDPKVKSVRGFCVNRKIIIKARFPLQSPCAAKTLVGCLGHTDGEW